ncbi:MAG: SurA N-terminal domain-containing protein [Acidobacteriota bacterium]|nr:SurA N-terminal domain-containing protein [Acidobacteriota bacterium]
MLKVFRDNLKKLAWTLWLVIIAFILSLSMMGGGTQGPTDAQTAATVGGDSITLQEFRRRYEATEQQMQAIYGQSYTPEIARQMGLAMQALDGLVAHKILVAEARSMGLQTSEAELQEAILDLPGFQAETGGFIGQDLYSQILRRNSYTVAVFEDEIRDQLLVDKLNAILSDTTFVSDEETLNAYKDEVERAKIRFLRVADERYRDQVVAEPSEVEEYFTVNQEDFTIPEKRAIDYLLVEPALLAANLTIDEADLRTYYDANQAEYTQEEEVRARHILLTASGDDEVAAAKARIEEIKGRLAGGEDFGTIASEVTEDQATKDRGGELGFFGRGRYNPALEEAAFGGQVGDLIGPVESNLITQTGLHLVEVLDRRDGGTQPFEDVMGGIRARLMTERSQRAASELASDLSARAVDEEIRTGEGLQALADGEESASFHTTEPFSRLDNVPGIGRGTSFTAAAFDLETGGVSEAAALPSGWAILHLREIQPERIPELEEVREPVRSAVLDSKQADAARTALSAALDRVRGGLVFDELAEELEVEVTESAEFSRTGFISELGRAEEVAAAAFDTAVGGFAGPISTPQGTLIFELVSKTEFEQSEYLGEQDATRERLQQERLNSLLLSLIEERRAQLGVEYNQQLLDSLGVFGTATAGS